LEWSWYLANDMQFFWLAPPLLILLKMMPLVASIVCTVLIAVCVLVQAIVIAQNNYVPTLLTTAEPAASVSSFCY
jgi:uncharacterized membrane protein